MMQKQCLKGKKRGGSWISDEFWKICASSKCPCKQLQTHEIIVIKGKDLLAS